MVCYRFMRQFGIRIQHYYPRLTPYFLESSSIYSEILTPTYKDEERSDTKSEQKPCPVHGTCHKIMNIKYASGASQ